MSEKPIIDKPIHAALVVVVMAMFAASYGFPYFFPIPEGDAGIMIQNVSKVIETVVILIVGYYFGSTATNNKRNEAITDAALTKPADPQPVVVTNTTTDPVPTEQQ